MPLRTSLGLLILGFVGFWPPSSALGVPQNPHEPELGPDINQTSRIEEEPRRPAVRMQDGMVYVSGGEFWMGHESSPSGEPNERPAHRVVVRPFWLDRTEVTVRDMRACIAQGDCSPPSGQGVGCTLSRSNARGDLPVNCIRWQAADAYCRAMGKRLPTEAEWEFAAGGGVGWRFPWGGAPPTCGIATTLVSNRSGVSCSPSGPSPVASHPRGVSPYGALDMAGNVEEWVADWYADRYELRTPATVPASSHVGPAFGVAHVLRGGGWMSRPREARVSARNWGSLNEAGPNVGFRCARD